MLFFRKNENELESRFFNSFFGDDRKSLMRTDIKENDNEYLVEIDLPGFNKENIEISYDKGYLNIKAKTTTEDHDSDYIRKERYYGETSRSYYLGYKVCEESIKATFVNGVLNVIVPKEKEVIEEKKFIKVE